eukprot:CAMPEP_0197605658 /NCGR_PEP_ID=MMETSP1326-20131121/43528_1 /TAXON_ID=1155430 /ORGANISM="Genus nov. species nov., Strain RCC2288" /LENGTH=531 /DNA_ID=CAMNT_0043173483 /DNA_START=38 /DNA_END=1630 /DNA_ORIENTATION=+
MPRFLLVVVAALATLGATADAAALTEQTVISSSSGVLSATIVVDEYTLTMASPAITIRTRGYNPSGTTMSQMAKGPTLRFKAGDKVNVTLQNDLGANSASSYTINTLHYPSTTNLHSHGLHIDADAPQDNVFTKVEPGAAYTYSYSIVADHAAGTHWYHAHVHGNTALQVGGGMTGVMIVDDAADEVPADLQAIAEKVMLIEVFEPSTVRALAAAMDSNAGDGWTATGDAGLTAGDRYVLVNGQYAPTLSIEAGQWTRLRMVFSSLEDTVSLTLGANSLGCEWKLLAKDGIYVASAPRALTAAYMAPGSRVDVVVKCTSQGTFSIEETPAANDAGPGGPPKRRRNLLATSSMLTVSVTASTQTAAGALTTFTAKKPSYLGDVYDETKHPAGATLETKSMTLAKADGACQVRLVSGAATVDKVWDNTAHGSMTVGTIQKWAISGQDKHPWHLHINSFQLSGVTDSSGFYVSGDWHDVFFQPAGVSVPAVYFSVDNHQSKAVMHCHFLEHEDKGCMAYVDISGTEGTRVPGMV